MQCYRNKHLFVTSVALKKSGPEPGAATSNAHRLNASRPGPRAITLWLQLAVLCWPVGSFGADDSGAQEPVEELVVTAARLPDSASGLPASLTRVDLKPVLNARQGLDFSDSLQTVPGLFVQSRYNASQDLRIDMRGFGARGNFGIRGIRIFIDGVPAGLPDGQVQVDSLDPTDISSIEVLRGPAAAQYGNGAGGVILIETRDLSDSPPWRLSTSLGDNGFSSWSANFRSGRNDADLLAGLGLSRLKLDGHRAQSRSDHRRAVLQLHADLGNGDQLQLRARAMDAPLAEDPGGLTFADLLANPAAAAANNLRFNAGEVLDQQELAWRWRRGEAGRAPRLEVSNYFTWREFANRLPFENGGAVRIDRRLGGIAAQYRLAQSEDGALLAGLELDRQEDRRRRFDNLEGNLGQLRLDQEEEVTAAGIFAGGQKRFGRLSLQAALRFDSLEVRLRDAFLQDGDDSGARRFNRFSEGLGIHWAHSADLKVWLRYASAFDTPTTTELDNPFGAGFNPALDPQHSRAYELGMRHRRQGKLPGVELALYQVDTRDELVAFELPAAPGRSFFENAGSTRRRGVELALANPDPEPLAWRLSATWADATFTRFVSDGRDFSGRQIPGSPGLRVAGSLDWFQGETWRLGMDAAWVRDIFADNANQVMAPAYLDVGLRTAVGARLGQARIEWHGGIRNLLDETYADNVRINAFGGRYFEPAPGRYFYTGLRLQGLP